MRSHQLNVLAVATLLCGIALGASPRPAATQELVPAAIGGFAGLAAGGYISIGIWTAKARYNDEYLFAAADALGWEASPVLAGMVTGAAVGFFDTHRLKRGVIGGSAGFLLGTGVGMTLGAAHWRLPEGRWAGGVIGGAAGVLVGSLVGLLWPEGDSATAPEESASRGPRIPIGFTLRF